MKDTKRSERQNAEDSPTCTTTMEKLPREFTIRRHIYKLEMNMSRYACNILFFISRKYIFTCVITVLVNRFICLGWTRRW